MKTEAVATASAIGYPVVLKLLSNTIAHKTDVDGVRLSLQNEDQLRGAFRSIAAAVTEKAGAQHFLGVTVQPMVRRDGYELILGSTIDAQFGPVILFGSGGVMVEVYRDRALALPPLNTTLAQRLMEQTKIFAALNGVRGRKPVDFPCSSNCWSDSASWSWSSRGSRKSTSIPCSPPLITCWHSTRALSCMTPA